MPSALWTGSLTCSFLNIPVKIYNTGSESRHKVSFNQLCADCGSRVRYKKICEAEQKELADAAINKGYEIQKDQYVVVDKKEIAAVKLKTTTELTILYFIDEQQFDEGLVRDNYYVTPAPKFSTKPYTFFAVTLGLASKVAVGKVVIKDKEHYVALRSHSNGLLMQTLYYEEEIFPLSDFAEMAKVGTMPISDEEIDVGVQLLQKMTKPGLDITEFKDEYVDAMREIIQAKANNQPIPIAPVQQAQPTGEQDLMAQLKASLEASR